MKLTLFLPSAVSLALFVSSALPARACGPYYPLIPTPEFFGLTDLNWSISDFDRTENLKLWQELTSRQIPLADIEEGVYRDSWEEFLNGCGYCHEETDNLFYIWLNNSDDQEIMDFLNIAKRLEEERDEISSPWYYPESRYSYAPTGDFSGIIDACLAYDGSRLRDRYALQATRAMFASRQYDRCIEYFDSAFVGIPDGNLMKRMAARYAAGCWSRLGEVGRADSIFALAGDILSLSVDDPLEYMARLNPTAPALMKYIRSHASDTLFMRETLPVACRILNDPRVRNKGDWSFMMAFVNNEYEGNKSLACSQIYQAMQQKFSSGEIKDLARAYKMKLDALTGNRRALIADLRWIESKTGMLNRDAEAWERRCRNIIYVGWIPRLWNRQDYATAILLCGYADNLGSAQRQYMAISGGTWNGNPLKTLSVSEMRASNEYRNSLDYGCLSFQMMGSLTSAQLAAVYNAVCADTPLYSFLRRKARTDRDYFYELIGTLALREENYSRAERYLSQVSDRYILTMNIEKDGYLSRDPFCLYPTRWTKFEYAAGDEMNFDRQSSPHSHGPGERAKLKFARRMNSYRYEMEHGLTADRRGMARLMYAIGRRNSFEECWALTQYWRGFVGKFEPMLQYWEDDFGENNYSFLYDYDFGNYKEVEEKYQQEVRASLAIFDTDEGRARANYILGNLAVVVRNYGGTPTGRFVKASCDNWKLWL